MDGEEDRPWALHTVRKPESLWKSVRQPGELKIALHGQKLDGIQLYISPSVPDTVPFEGLTNAEGAPLLCQDEASCRWWVDGGVALDANEPTVRILAIVSRTDPTQDESVLKATQALADAIGASRPDAKVEREVVATRREIEAALRKPATALHLWGHGEMRGMSAGAPEPLEPHTLADWCVASGNRYTLCTVAACESGRKLARELVARGVTPFAIANLDSPLVVDARRFYERLYRELIAGVTVDDALRAARRELRPSPEFQARFYTSSFEDKVFFPPTGAVEVDGWIGSKIYSPYVLGDLRDLVGRQAELEELDRLLLDPPIPAMVVEEEGEGPLECEEEPHLARIVCLEALGGSGKSHLAWSWLRRWGNRERTSWERLRRKREELEGVVWTSFYEPNYSFKTFLDQLAHFFGLQSQGVPSHLLTQQLLDQLRSHPILLVLDGLEREMDSYRSDLARMMDDMEREERSERLDVEDFERTFISESARAFFRALPNTRARVLITSRLVPLELFERDEATLRSGCVDWPLQAISEGSGWELYHRYTAPDNVCDRSAFLGIWRHLIGGHPQVLIAMARAANASGMRLDEWVERNGTVNLQLLRRYGPEDMDRLPGSKTSRRYDWMEKSMDVLLGGSDDPEAEKNVRRTVLEAIALSSVRISEEDLVAQLGGETAHLRKVLRELQRERLIVGVSVDGKTYDMHPVVRAYFQRRWELSLQGLSQKDLEDQVTQAIEVVPLRADLVGKKVAKIRALLSQSEWEAAWNHFDGGVYQMLRHALMDGQALDGYFDHFVGRNGKKNLLPPLRDRAVQASIWTHAASHAAEAGRPEPDARLHKRAAVLNILLGNHAAAFDLKRGASWSVFYSGQLREAEASLQAVLKTGVENDMAQLWLGLVHAIRGEMPSPTVLGIVEDMLGTQPRWALQTLAEAQVYAGDALGALATMRRLFRDFADDFAPRGQLLWEDLTWGTALVRSLAMDAALNHQVVTEALSALDQARSAAYQSQYWLPCLMANSVMAELAVLTLIDSRRNSGSALRRADRLFLATEVFRTGRLKSRPSYQVPDADFALACYVYRRLHGEPAEAARTEVVEIASRGGEPYVYRSVLDRLTRFEEVLG